MPIADLQVELRETSAGSPKAKVIRREGKIPGIFYSHDQEPISITTDSKIFKRISSAEVNILNVIFPGDKTHKCIIKEIQRDPVTDEIIHTDLMGIKLTEKVKLTIPIVLKGAAVGVKEGGILEHMLREVEVEGLPLEIPEHLELDVSEMNIGDSKSLEDISIEKIRFVTDTKHGVVHVVHPKVVQEVVEEDELEGIEGEEEGDQEAASESEGD